MSIEMMSLVMLARIEEPNIKFVLLMYANYAGKDGENIFPAIKTVAKITGYSERTVQRLTKELDETHRYLLPDGQGPRGTNKWRLNTDLLWSLVDPNDLPRGMMDKMFQEWTARQAGGDNLSGDDNLTEGGDILSEGGDILSRGGDMHVTRSLNNPHLEPSKKPVSPGGSTGVFSGGGVKEKIPSVSGKSNLKGQVREAELEPSDAGGAPEGVDPKTAMEKMLIVWQRYFPEKDQPKPERYMRLLNERLADPDFCNDWLAAIEKATRSKYLRASGWFQFRWLLRDGENVLKVKQGHFDGFNKQLAEEEKKAQKAQEKAWASASMDDYAFQIIMEIEQEKAREAQGEV